MCIPTGRLRVRVHSAPLVVLQSWLSAGAHSLGASYGLHAQWQPLLGISFLPPYMERVFCPTQSSFLAPVCILQGCVLSQSILSPNRATLPCGLCTCQVLLFFAA